MNDGRRMDKEAAAHIHNGILLSYKKEHMWVSSNEVNETRAYHTDQSEVAQSCPTLCYRMDCSLPGSSVHGIFQARVLEWVTISFSRGSSRPRDQTRVSRIVGRRFTVWATREAHTDQSKSERETPILIQY